MTTDALRAVVAGATGALGVEVVDALERDGLSIVELVPVATERSLGSFVDFRGDSIAVESELPPLRGFDWLIVCTPAEAARELVREALRAETPCIDCSGSFMENAEVPVVLAAIAPDDAAIAAPTPLVSAPSALASMLAPVLAALEAAAGLSRVVATTLHPVSRAGRPGIESLSQETVALLSQSEPPVSRVFPRGVAFDCAQASSSELAGEAEVLEERVASELRRLLGADLQLALSAVQVPTFVGDGGSLTVETARPLAIEEAVAALEKAAGVELWIGDAQPSTRDTAGREDVLVGRPRQDRSVENGLQLWLAADGLGVVASNVAKLLEARRPLAS